MPTNAYKLCLGLLAQDSAGKAYEKLPEEYATLTWGVSSIIPAGYEFTNFQVGDTTVETVEKNTITALTKAKKYDSGAITPPTYTFANMSGADVASIVSILDKLEGVEDPFKVLFVAGVYKSAAGDMRTYEVFTASAAIVTTDGGRTAEAKAIFTGSLGLQSCHIPLVGVSECAATLTWNTKTNAVNFSTGS